MWNGVGKIDFPLRTRLTSITGETVGGDITKLVNDKDQDSGFQYKPIKEGTFNMVVDLNVKLYDITLLFLIISVCLLLYD